MTRQHRLFLALCSTFLCVASDADATYLTITNETNRPVMFVNMAFWDLSQRTKLGELWSSDDAQRPPSALSLDITKAHPLIHGQTYITPVIPWLPDAGFVFGGIGAFSDHGFQRLLPSVTLSGTIDPHLVIIPGDLDCTNESYVAAGRTAVPCSALIDGGLVLRITVHAGAPPFNFSGVYPPTPTRSSDVPEVSAGAPIAVRVYFRPAGDDGRSPDQGFDIFQSGFPASQPMACTPSGVALTAESVSDPVTASEGILSYEGNYYYTYVWQTREYWANSCRQLMFKFTDRSVRVADFQFR